MVLVLQVTARVPTARQHEGNDTSFDIYGRTVREMSGISNRQSDMQHSIV